MIWNIVGEKTQEVEAKIVIKDHKEIIMKGEIMEDKIRADQIVDKEGGD